MHLHLTIVVLAFNEEHNIARCLNSVRELTAEVIVVDSGSTDNTAAIATSLGAKVIQHPWEGMAVQRRFALAQGTQPWVLALDCDEELSPELIASIRAFLEGTSCENVAGAICNRRVWFLGRWILHGDWYPDRKLRLVCRESATVSGEGGHDRIEVTGTTIRLKGDMHHYSFPDIKTYLHKLERFSSEFLAHRQERGHKWTLSSTVIRPFWRFFRAYFIRRGFLDGFPGFWIAIATAFHAFIRYSRLYDAERSATKPEAKASVTEMK